MKIANLINFLETIAPPSYQESYDNAGLIVGNREKKIRGVLICLDSTEDIISEAVENDCNLVIAHHPIVFKGLKKINGNNYVERVIIKAIKHDVAIYAIHTNLDNVYHNGVNAEIAKRLGLINTRILAPKKNLKKLHTFVPTTHSEMVRQALFSAGAGQAGQFEHLSHASVGMGTQNGSGGAEVKLEVLYSNDQQGAIMRALHNSHPSEKIPYDIFQVENHHAAVGAGMIGELEEPTYEKPFLQFVKKVMKVSCLKYTNLKGRKVSKIAVCGGSGSFLLPKAIAQKAHIFITADYKYHEFFDADDKIVIADIGHYESEQYTINLLYKIITNNFSKFAVYCTDINTNPVKYL